MKTLTLKQAKRIVWLTWSEIIIAGAIAVWGTDPTKLYIIWMLAILVADGLYRLFKKYKKFPKSMFSAVPTLFLPSCFFSIIAAIVVGLSSMGNPWNSWTIGLATVGIVYFIASIPESKY